jgi:hypothetical protein
MYISKPQFRMTTNENIITWDQALQASGYHSSASGRFRTWPRDRPSEGLKEFLGEKRRE